MVQTSDRYKALATAPGRAVYCTIEAGELTFSDADIIGFEFQDVVHAEEMAFGSTAASRFHFEVITDGYIPLSAVIKPFISFEGSDERCPLGVFYIAKRYRRRSRYSITCYDRMYQLDDIYETELSFPATAQDALDDICERLSIDCSVVCGDYSCTAMPGQATFRDVIGYIAGLHGAAAKFGRDGALCFRTLEDCGFTVTRDNYVSLSMKQDPCEIRQINVQTDAETFISGDGTRLSTYVMYNPFGDQGTADRLLSAWENFSYYGMDVEMQGLPFLEAGDRLTVQNDNDNGLFTAIVSELDFVYDGALSMTLCSRSKNPVDDYENASDQSSQLEAAEENLRVVYYTYSNPRAVSAGQELTKIVDVDVLSERATGAVFAAQLPVTASADCVLTLSVRLNDAEIRVLTASLRQGENVPLCIHWYFPALQTGFGNVKVYASASAGYARFAANSICATLSGQYLAAATISRSPNRTVTENVGGLSIEGASRMIAFGEVLASAVQSPLRKALSETAAFAITPASRSVGFTEELSFPCKPETLTLVDGAALTLVMSNPVTLSGTSPESAFTALITAQGKTAAEITSVTQTDCRTLTLSLSQVYGGTPGVRLDYAGISEVLHSVMDGTAVSSFAVEV